MNTRSLQQSYRAVRDVQHPRCVACCPDHQGGWQLQFTRLEDGSVGASFDCDRAWEGYPDCLHGGVIASLLDAAMTNCLFADNIVAFTAELNIRYHETVRIGQTVRVRAWRSRSSPRLYLLQAELTQDGQIKASASAKFMPDPMRRIP